MQVGGDVLRPTCTVGTHQDLPADIATGLGSGQCPVGVTDQGDVVVGIVDSDVTGAHQQRQRFATQAGAVVDERSQGVNP